MQHMQMKSQRYIQKKRHVELVCRLHFSSLKNASQQSCNAVQSWQLLPLSTRQRTFFKYEKRIRDLSGPDKIFEYFATEEKADGTRSDDSISRNKSIAFFVSTMLHILSILAVPC